jgi:3-deoxy-manno-octulosonate cytidylyltransferase (CMP-KDO synthetase)
MVHGRTLVVIPARLGSERLPRKPLHPLAGRPLIEWVWRRIQGFEGLDRIVVATESEEVVSVCRAMGAEVELTSPDHASGTDRVAEVAERAPYREYAVIVNVQGDEPFVGRDDVMQAASLVRAGWDVGTVATPLGNAEDLADPGVVKVVRRSDGGALYFSRAAVPYMRDRTPDTRVLGTTSFLRHIGIYAYRRDALMRWVALPPSELEQIERLEQLRALEAGISFGVGIVQESERGIDTPEDARRAEVRLREREKHLSTIAIG